MATTPQQPQHQAPPAARPGAPTTPAKEPDKKDASTEEKKEPEEKVVDKDEVKNLFQAGHRLKKKGDPADKWIAATRLHNVLCLAQPLDEELEKKVLGQELVLVAD